MSFAFVECRALIMSAWDLLISIADVILFQ